MYRIPPSTDLHRPYKQQASRSFLAPETPFAYQAGHDAYPDDRGYGPPTSSPTGNMQRPPLERLPEVDAHILDLIVAGVLALKGDAEPGPTLQGLDGVRRSAAL